MKMSFQKLGRRGGGRRARRRARVGLGAIDGCGEVVYNME